MKVEDFERERRLSTTVKPFGGRVFRVRSESDPETFYLVDLEERFCSCPNYQFRKDVEDKHIELARQYLRMKGREEERWKKRS